MRSNTAGWGLILLTLLCLIAPAAFSADEALRSKIQIADPVFDFGRVVQGTKVSHDFAIKNVGAAELVIQSIVPGCGCTVSSASAERLAPGAEGTIKVDFDTSGFSGEKSRAVRVYSNDLDKPTSVLTVKGLIETDVVVEPSAVRFEDMRAGVPHSMPVSVSIKEGSDAKIIKLSSFNPSIIIEQKDRGDKLRKFDVSIKPDAKPGQLRGRVIVTLSDNRTINVPVFASIKGSIELSPDVVSFGVIDDTSQILRHSVKLVNHAEGKPFAIKEVRSNIKALSGAFKVMKAGSAYVIDVSVDPKQIQNSLRGALTIITDSKEVPEIALNVYGVLAPKI